MASQKFRDLVHYIVWSCEDPSTLGATKLNKIAWFVDTLAYRRDGVSVTGETYVKRQYGPVPKHILGVLADLTQEGKIASREPMSDFQPREFVALTPPDDSSFSEREKRLIDVVINNVCRGHSANSISQLSHDQVWDAAKLGEEIPLYAVLASVPGELVDDDYEWANGVIDVVLAERDSGNKASLAPIA